LDIPDVKVILGTSLGDEVRSRNTCSLQYRRECPKCASHADRIRDKLLHGAFNGRGLVEAAKVPKPQSWV